MDQAAFFRDCPKAALAFSGGTDSAYLLWAALEAGARIRPYFLSTPFQPARERAEALALARRLRAELTVVELALPRPVLKNPPQRCYLCKRAMFEALRDRAAADGYPVVLEGTNASDRPEDRPGMAALRELGVLSPLRLWGLTKEEIRRRSRAAGLPTWDKPACACLATRFPTGTAITAADLARVEAGEETLMALGYRDFRLRLRPWGALFQVHQDQKVRAGSELEKLRQALAPWFDRIELDENTRGRRENG